MLLFLVALLVGVALGDTYVQLDPKAHMSAELGYLRIGRSDGAHRLAVHIALTHEKTHDDFHQILMATALPLRARQFLSEEEGRQIFRPLNSNAVIDWLLSSGVANEDIQVIAQGDWLQVSLSVSKAEQLFQAKFYDYHHTAFPATVFKRTQSYYVPSSVAPYVEFVAIKRLHNFRRHVNLSGKRAPFSSLVGPKDVRNLFSIPSSVTGSKTNGNSQSVAQFLGQFYSPRDLKAYEAHYGLPPANVTLIGPNDPKQPGVEAELDIQQITGVNQGTPTFFHSTAGLHQQQEPFLKWLLDLAENPTRGPKTHSVSYGDTESSLDDSFLERVNTEFMKLGTFGHTFIYASGDSGVSCSQGGTRQEPDFPASSPYVTAVGGVVLVNNQVQSWSGSGGGFSRKFARLAFMNKAQEAYINSHSQPPHSYYNTSGRGYPDVSGISLNVAVQYQDRLIDVGGTSCAAPQFSALVTLLKDAMLSKGKAPVGYLNPLIYSWADAAFSEVTQGPPNSAGGCPGFSPVQSGWDPLNGLGILSYQKAVMQL